MAQSLLRDQVALVTGAATGIGESIARLFSEHGARVALVDINLTGATTTAASIAAAGGQAVGLFADVRDRESVGKAVDDTLARFGRIDILINNAGIYPRRAFLDMTEAEWDDMQNTNLKGVFYCLKLVVPHMVAQRRGKIVNISSVTFFKGFPTLSHYVAAKGGVIGLGRSLARELGPHNVYVNTVTPGAIEVEMEKRVATPEQMQAIVAQQCLERRLQPIDVARVCLFLASELSSGVTGQIVNVDGGLIMY
jgi:3-oxoacyl-[acyl-carrier protein] reductase